MRRWMMVLAILSLALLAACASAGNGGNTQNAGQNDSQTQTDSQTPGETDGQEERPLYVFVGGQLVGSWENGQWISAVPLGEYEGSAFVSAGDGASRDYTLAELLNQDGYYVYTPDMGETCADQCELYTLSDGPGSFDWDLRDTVEQLDDYALSVPEEEWERRTFALPTVLEGEVAELLVPNYSFTVTFDEVYPEVAMSQPLEELPIYPEDTDGADYREMVDTYLMKQGIVDGVYQISSICRGEDGTVYLAVNSAFDEMGYWLEDSEQVFSLVLCRRANGNLFSGQIIVQVLHTCPCRRFAVGIDIVPAEIRRKVHNPAARKQALGGKVCTVSSDLFVVIEPRISAISPCVRIFHSR